MIRLGLPREPRWLNLSNGVRVKVRPLTTAIYEAARSSGNRKATELGIEQGLIKAAGGSISDLPDSSDRDGLAGLSQMLFCQALAVHATIEWEGVGDLDGNPAPVTEENVETMIRDFPGIADDFLVRYIAPMAAMVTEGNGSGTAPNGTSEAVPSTVTLADQTILHAHVENEIEKESDALTGNPN